MARAQSASEYIILLAMVLIVSLIGIVLVGGFGDAGSAAMDTESKMYWANANPFAINEWNQINNTLYLKLKNRRAARLILRSFVIGNVTADLGTGWTILGGQERNISITGFRTCDPTSYDTFSYNVSIYYDTESLTNVSQFGTKQLAGRCLVQ